MDPCIPRVKGCCISFPHRVWVSETRGDGPGVQDVNLSRIGVTRLAEGALGCTWLFVRVLLLPNIVTLSRSLGFVESQTHL